MQELLAELDLRTSSQGDFDFLLGRRRVAHRRLKERLVGAHEWHTFETDYECWALAGGMVNVDHQCLKDAAFLSGSEAPFYGVSVRSFEAATKLWTIYWLDSIRARLEFQVAGAFTGHQGLFYGTEEFAGRPRALRFLWDLSNPEVPRWEQAYEDDHGDWETNWIMEFTARE